MHWGFIKQYIVPENYFDPIKYNYYGFFIFYTVIKYNSILYKLEVNNTREKRIAKQFHSMKMLTIRERKGNYSKKIVNILTVDTEKIKSNL